MRSAGPSSQTLLRALSTAQHKQVHHSQFVLIENFLPIPTLQTNQKTKEQQSLMLIKAIDLKLRRVAMKYQEGHFDGVIKGYRECTATDWIPPLSPQGTACFPSQIIYEMQRIIRRELLQRFPPPPTSSSEDSTVPCNSLRFNPSTFKFNPPHILDLKEGKESGIGPHVDLISSSGYFIGGLSLISPCTMIFKRVPPSHAAFQGMSPSTTGSGNRRYTLPPPSVLDEPAEFEISVPPNSLYIQFGDLRYNYTHEIPTDSSGRGRRVVIILRDTPP